MNKITVDQLLSKSRNKFLLANALGKRAKQITDGSLPYVDDFNPANPIITAMKEIAADKIKIKVLAGPAKAMPLIIEEGDGKKFLSLAKEVKKKQGKKK